MWSTSLISWFRVKEITLDNLSGPRPISRRSWQKWEFPWGRRNSVSGLQHQLQLENFQPACLPYKFHTCQLYSHISQFLEINTNTLCFFEEPWPICCAWLLRGSCSRVLFFLDPYFRTNCPSHRCLIKSWAFMWGLSLTTPLWGWTTSFPWEEGLSLSYPTPPPPHWIPRSLQCWQVVSAPECSLYANQVANVPTLCTHKEKRLL